MAECGCELEVENAAQARVLRIVFAINGAMFLAEFVTGFFAESTALIADSFDMLADSAVYAVSLVAVSRGPASRASAARLSGQLQIGLGGITFLEVARRALMGSSPEPLFMMAVAMLALVANVICLRLIAAHREGGVHMRASMIFSQNDVIANAGVIATGALIALTHWAFLDLLAGTCIGMLVCHGGVRILREARAAARDAGREGPQA